MKKRRAAAIVAIAAVVVVGVWAAPEAPHELAGRTNVWSRVKALTFVGPAAWSSFVFHLRTGR
jgi:hypothetical protein